MERAGQQHAAGCNNGYGAELEGGSDNRRCYLGNLSYGTSWQDLKGHFRQAGTVVSSNVMKEMGTGRSKGCGIVVFSTAVEAAWPIEVLHASILQGRPHLCS